MSDIRTPARSRATLRSNGVSGIVSRVNGVIARRNLAANAKHVKSVIATHAKAPNGRGAMPGSPTPGDRIRERQDAAAVTNRELAAAAGVSESTVSQWRRNRQQPKDRHLRAIAPLLGTTVGFLRYGTPDRSAEVTVHETPSQEYNVATGLP